MKLNKLVLILTCCLLTCNVWAQRDIQKPFTQQQQQAIAPQDALKLLKEGNKRFVKDAEYRYDYDQIREFNASGQYPFAVIVSCLDSRSSPDVLFDQAPGNLFVGRVAGNVVDTNMLGSLEFATKYAGAKLVVILGHTSCGAVKGACAGVGEANLKKLLETIQPAVETKQIIAKKSNDCSSADDIKEIAEINVRNQLVVILSKSPTLRQLVKEKKIMLVGAMHDIATGEVNFLY